MEIQPVILGLQRDGDAHLSPELAGISQQRPQRIHGTLKQQIPHRLKIPVPQVIPVNLTELPFLSFRFGFIDSISHASAFVVSGVINLLPFPM